MMTRRLFWALFVLVGLSSLLDCTSRYRLDLYMTADESRRKMKLEGSEFSSGAAINPAGESILQPGPADCITLTLATRGQRNEAPPYSALWYDEYLIFKVYLQLPPSVKPATIPLAGNSLVYLAGRYDQPADTKRYLPTEGTLVVDSVTTHYLFGTINGAFINPKSQVVSVDGRFKVRVSR